MATVVGEVPIVVDTLDLDGDTRVELRYIVDPGVLEDVWGVPDEQAEPVPGDGRFQSRDRDGDRILLVRGVGVDGIAVVRLQEIVCCRPSCNVGRERHLL